MLPTVSEILQLDPVRAGDPEVLCSAGLDRPVRWVHVSDVANLARLLSGGELVLTTGAAMVDVDAATRYLPDLNDAGAVGLFVELGTSVESVDPYFVAQAIDLGFPLVALRRQTKFVDVTEAVHRSIVAEQYDEVEFARRAHEVFTDLTMKRASMTDIINAAAEMVDEPLVLEDLNHQVLVVDARGSTTAEVLDDWERTSRLTPTSNVTVQGGPRQWIATPVGPHRQSWGRLIAPRSSDSPRERMIVERTAQALAMRRMVEQDLTSLEQQAQTGLLDDLRRGRIDDEGEATARAHALGLRPALTYIPMAVRVDESVRADQVVAQRRQTRLLDAARHAIRADRQTALTANRQVGHIDVLLAQPPVGDVDAALASVASAIRTALNRIDGVTKCAIGVGPSSTRLLDAVGGLEDAAHVAEVALSLPSRDTRPFHRAVDIRLRGLFALLSDDPRVQAFAESELRGILDHRARHDDDAFDILRAFLDVGGNKTELAKRMHMSRPTLYARLATISRILGVDLDDAESRTSLHAALLIMEM